MFRGSFPALVTPFKDGAVDTKALADLVEWHISEGSHGLVPVGTTGESPTLTHEEHEQVIEEVVRTSAGRVPVIAGAGSNNTVEAMRFVQHAARVGADGALVVTPYYNKPTQRGMIEHFTRLNNCADIPIIIYNIPGRSVVDMSVETMASLAKLKNIVGVKDSTGDVVRVSETRHNINHEFCQMSGEDPMVLAHMAHGGHGCISVTANVAPRLMAEFQNACLAGDFATALEYQNRLLPLHKALFIEPGLVGAKYGLSVLGRCDDEVRCPLTTAQDDTKAKIREAMVFAGIING